MSTLIELRAARSDDLGPIVAMLADDPLGAMRERYETPLPACYAEAFDAIDRDANQELIVAVRDETVVGVLQLTFIPSITHQGGWRGQIEGVRVASSCRSLGIGRLMFEHAIERAKQRNCRMVQLTTDKTRPEALSFYEGLGFKATHEGMKLPLL